MAARIGCPRSSAWRRRAWRGRRRARARPHRPVQRHPASRRLKRAATARDADPPSSLPPLLPSQQEREAVQPAQGRELRAALLRGAPRGAPLPPLSPAPERADDRERVFRLGGSNPRARIVRPSPELPGSERLSSSPRPPPPSPHLTPPSPFFQRGDGAFRKVPHPSPVRFWWPTSTSEGVQGGVLGHAHDVAGHLQQGGRGLRHAVPPERRRDRPDDAQGWLADAVHVVPGPNEKIEHAKHERVYGATYEKGTSGASSSSWRTCPRTTSS